MEIRTEICDMCGGMIYEGTECSSCKIGPRI